MSLLVLLRVLPIKVAVFGAEQSPALQFLEPSQAQHSTTWGDLQTEVHRSLMWVLPMKCTATILDTQMPFELLSGNWLSQREILRSKKAYGGQERMSGQVFSPSARRTR